METATKACARRVAGALGVLALGTMGGTALIFPASIATAAVQAAGPGNIAPDTNQSSIVVHKYSQPSPASTSGGNGTPQTVPAGAEPLDGVIFDLYRLDGINLTTTAGWNTATAISAAGGVVDSVTRSGGTVTAVTIGGVSYPVSAAVVPTQTTAGGGVATFSGLPYGIYVVVEGADTGNNHITNTAAPFVVSLPFANNNTWLYEVNAYPKNSVTSVTKTVSAQSGLGLGATVAFPVTVAIPSMTTGASITSFEVKDTLDSRLTSVGVVDVRLNTPSGTPVASTAYDVDTSGNTVTVTFNSDGLIYLNDPARIGQKIVVTFQGTVSTLGDGEITNTATALVNGPSFDSNQVTSKWGQLAVEKQTSGSSPTTLEGAVFEVYAATTPYPASNDCSTATATGSAITVDGVSQFTSDATGAIVIPGLFVSSSAEGATATQRCYVLREVVPPNGYVLPSNPNTGVAVVPGATAASVVTVSNTQVAPWALPLTGGAGTLPFTLGGAGILVAAVGGGIYLSRRQKSQA